MGGWGSGRPEKWNRKKTTRTASVVDVLTWHRHGKLTPGNVFEWGHTWGGLTLGEAFLTLSKALLAVPPLRVEVVHPERLDQPERLDVLFPRYEQDRPPVPIALEWMPCPFGGYRPFLHCPGCQKRLQKLFLEIEGLRPKLRCRVCLGLAYESQRQDAARRQAEKAKRGRRKVGGWLSGGLLTPFPDRPKGMHQATYERLREASLEAEICWLDKENKTIEAASEYLHRKFPGMKQQ